MNLCLIKRCVYQRFYVTFQQKTNNLYKNTLSLPQTKFPLWPLKGCLDSKEFEILTQRLYQWQKTYLPREKIFILHDGPPYANGTLHLGHALNKILKDVILRINIMKGRPVSYIPGWDCHGLPIELKVLEDDEDFTFHKSPMIIRRKAREYVLETIRHQKESFKSFGIMADWEKSYHTLDLSYIIQQLEIFKKMVEKG